MTLTGLASRLIGFFYRIYLARLFGEEGMGIYQLIGPVLSLSFSLTSAGYQTAVSKLVAENTAKQKNNTFRPLLAALSISLPLSLLCNLFIYHLSDYIAVSFLFEARTAPMLRVLSFSIPITAVHACINGYFYGVKKTSVPAATQLLEQCIRVGCVYCISTYALAHGASLTINVAVLGLVIGEFGSMLLSVVSIYVVYWRLNKSFNASLLITKRSPNQLTNCPGIYRALMGMVIPLTANRITLNILQSIEAVSLPAKLRFYGYDQATALSIYGVLTGMAMPLIFFPNALTSSVSVLLLPMISEAHALGDMHKVKKYTLQTIKLCTLMGVICMSVFLLLGSWAGSKLFHSELAGHFIMTLSFLCPFLYLDTTLSSILQGLGMASRIFIMNAVSLLLRLAFVFWAVPKFGITGYLWGILASQILLSAMYLICLLCLRHQTPRSNADH